MKHPIFYILLTILAIFTGCTHSYAQHDSHHHNHNHDNDLSFIQNKGQWGDDFEYKASLGGLNTVFLERQGFTYLFHDETNMHKIYDHSAEALNEGVKVNAHAYRVNFVNSKLPTIKGEDVRTEYYNYFLGNDPSKWVSHVSLFDKLVYHDLYEGVNLETYDINGHFKYDFIVQPGADPNQIILEYEGADRLSTKNGDLIIHTSVDKIIEHAPLVYQNGKDKMTIIKCDYQLSGNQVTFSFPEGYDRSIPLIIDPTVVAATLSGTTGNRNFGHSATYDYSGNIYVGARSFGSGYPVNTGAFQTIYGGGDTDIAVSKYNVNGTQLEYASYIGGTGRDLPHSLITDFDGQLYIYGTTESTNYPTSSNAVQTNRAGMIDIVVTVLNSDGSDVVGSTYIGGSNDDGLSTLKVSTSSGAVNNYGDEFRGEIMLDNQRNVYVVSHTNSNNFPTTAGAFDRTFNTVSSTIIGANAQDAVVFKLNNDLSDFYFSTFLGENGTDTGMGIRVDNQNNIFVTGTAAGSNFPSTSGTFNPGFNGGQFDAYMVKLSADGSTMLKGSFFGTNNNDFGYFLDLDIDGEVHIYGLTTGIIPVTPAGTYSNISGSKQYLASFDSNLNNRIYSTVIGRGGQPNDSGFTDFDFVPVAFMVDKCDNIYFSGYAANSNLPTTSNAISGIAGTFYLGVLFPDATGLSFATYYANANHVDGGTSRFDKSGVVYQGVCSCMFMNENSVMNTNPNAYATSQTTECDNGVFKIDFEVPTVTAFAVVEPASSGCAPFTANFDYTGKNATIFEWDFGNGQTSTLENPSVTFTEAGTYTVKIIASNTATCNLQDTFYLDINVIDDISNVVDTVVCGASQGVFVNVTTTNANYQWNDGSINATKNITTEGVHWVDVSIAGCTRRDSFLVNFAPEFNYTLGEDFSFCDTPQSDIDASATDVVYYEWDNGSNNPIRTISSAGQYDIYVEDSEGCRARDTIEINFGTTPLTELGTPDTLCLGDQRQVTAVNTLGIPVNYQWNTGATTETITVTEPGDYIVLMENEGCFFQDTISIHYNQFDLVFDQEDVSCFGECDANGVAIPLGESPPFAINWYDGSSDAEQTGLCAGEYYITVTDDRNCVHLDTLIITQPDTLLGEIDIFDVTCFADSNGVVQITNIIGGSGPFDISYDNGSTFVNSTSLTQLSGGTYQVLIQDQNGCTYREDAFVYEPPLVTVDAGPDQTIMLGESTKLSGQVFPLENQFIQWQEADSLECPTCLDSTVDPTRSTIYTLVATDTLTGCVVNDEVLIQVDKERNVYIPNAFSPNADGNNDIFQIYTGVGVQEIEEIRIFDRWGELVYEGTNIPPVEGKHGWDGYFKGDLMNSAVFVYYTKIRFLDDVVKVYSGDVTLLR